MAARSVPRYTLHKPTGYARVRIGGKDHYLGVYGSPDSHQRYAALIADWQSRQGESPKNLTLGQVALMYLEHCRSYYVKDGHETSEVVCSRVALRYITRIYGMESVAAFSPKKLTAARQQMIADGLARTCINGYVARIRRMFRWGVAEELVPATVLKSLEAVAGLQRGRTQAKESKAVKPVPEAHINAVETHVPPTIWGIIQFQLWTGARPSEALLLRGRDLNVQGEVWEYRPASHKTEHHDKDRLILIGQRGQAVLREFLSTNLDAYVFAPAGSDGRKPYRRDSYRLAIIRGCELAFEMPDELRHIATAVAKLPKAKQPAERKRLQRLATEWHRDHCWSPHQLRHNFATLARREFGIEAARVTLGHSSAVTTEIYAERDIEAARAVVARIG